jgi:(p)ppGpp synthase/HD superfamily hydrolase
MSLILVIRNVTKLTPVSDYTYEVFINERVIASGTVIGHTRDEGWEALVRKLLAQRERKDEPMDQTSQIIELAVAERLARKAHAGQVEKWGGHPYIRHIERVVAAVDSHDEKLTAWLHDVIEDSNTTADDLLRAGIPASVVDAVWFLTRGDETYAEYIEALRAAHQPLAVAVKIADLRDHLREETLAVLPVNLRRRYEQALERLI